MPIHSLLIDSNLLILLERSSKKTQPLKVCIKRVNVQDNDRREIFGNKTGNPR